MPNRRSPKAGQLSRAAGTARKVTVPERQGRYNPCQGDTARDMTPIQNQAESSGRVFMRGVSKVRQTGALGIRVVVLGLIFGLVTWGGAPSLAPDVHVYDGRRYGFDVPTALAVAGVGIWFTSHKADGRGVVTELNAITGRGRNLSGRAYGFERPAAIAVDSDRVWITSSDFSSGRGLVTELSTSGRLLRLISLRNFTNLGAIVGDGSRVWIADPSESGGGTGSALVLNGLTGGLILALSGSRYDFNDPDAIAVDGSHVWIANGGGDLGGPGSVAELNSISGRLIRIPPSRLADKPQAIKPGR
jgi:hypothetical protein